MSTAAHAGLAEDDCKNNTATCAANQQRDGCLRRRRLDGQRRTRPSAHYATGSRRSLTICHGDHSTRRCCTETTPQWPSRCSAINLQAADADGPSAKEINRARRVAFKTARPDMLTGPPEFSSDREAPGRCLKGPFISGSQGVHRDGDLGTHAPGGSRMRELVDHGHDQVELFDACLHFQHARWDVVSAFDLEIGSHDHKHDCPWPHSLLCFAVDAHRRGETTL